jgi:hypothetical protein
MNIWQRNCPNLRRKCTGFMIFFLKNELETSRGTKSDCTVSYSGVRAGVKGGCWGCWLGRINALH